MLLGTEVSAGWVDKAAARVNAQLKAAGFDDAMIAALAAEDVLAADETPVNVLDKSLSRPRRRKRRGGAAPRAGGWPCRGAWAPRRKGSVGGGIPAAFAGYLITDGYTGYQHLLSRIAGIQQCAQHVIRRCRAVQN